MLKRNAIVRSKIEKAQGLTLSRSAAMPTSGKNQVPPRDSSQSAAVAPPLNRKNPTSPARNTATATNTISRLFMVRLRSYIRRESKNQRLPRAFFEIDFADNFAHSRRSVGRGIERNNDLRLASRFHGYVSGRNAQAMPGHAEGPLCDFTVLKHRLGAHAGGIDFLDGGRSLACVFNTVAIADTPAGH